MGLVSMATAAFFMINQRDLKRMLAYSSIEHMGILTIGLGIGTPALFGTLLHVIANGLTKGVLFLSVGNIHRAFGSKNIDQVRGALRLIRSPAPCFLSVFWQFRLSSVCTFCQYVFYSQWCVRGREIYNRRFVSDFPITGFHRNGSTDSQALQEVHLFQTKKMIYRDTFASYLPIIGLLILVFLFGVYIPSPLSELLNDAVSYLGGQP